MIFSKIRFSYIAVLFVAIFGLIGYMINLSKHATQIRQVNLPFAEVVQFLSTQFKTDITVAKGKEVWGPCFLDTGTLYRIHNEINIPDYMIRFKASYYQIGGEEYIFTVTNEGGARTKISVSHIVNFIITFRGLRSNDRKILDAINEMLVIGLRGKRDICK